MSQPFEYPALDPLAGLPADRAPLTEEKAADGKALLNPPSDKLSPWYSNCVEVIDESNNAFDLHIYYNQNSPGQLAHARALHERIRREFPELRVYKFWEVPVGPHPVAMFEVNTFTPAQLGAIMGFLVAYRGGLSVLIHPNTDDEYRDHTERATWMGQPYPLNVSFLRKDKGRFTNTQ
ncbi:DOPA-like domain-containing protein [Leucosporidium creatinivorum]|uniref:DOPA-like domain-containing protein n=1 Tax=Leucosporidium creatinivorum TaxID=106004 RepID=A0A1Y2D828_9BASI|nr:DOPA-like domain-containing protein [Leucosporidium creatinivorum]